mgnify:CR=1 FL=1
MNIKQIKSTTLALLAAGILVLVVGTYTSNGGFQLAGGMLLVVVAILAFNQARDRTGNR